MKEQITFERPQPNDYQAIAQLHTQNWQQSYRGMLSDDYLDNVAPIERLSVWKKRFEKLNVPNYQYIKLAKANQVLCGFACTYLNQDEQWGALLDNLHVADGWKGQGIGRKLMVDTAQYLQKVAPSSNLYLWVLADNTKAIRFYERLGGINQEAQLTDMPGGNKVNSYRFVWTPENMHYLY